MKYMSPMHHVRRGLTSEDAALTSCVDVFISFQNADIVSFPDTLKGRHKACESSTDDQDVDTCGLV
jgi:hypothetical protein